MTTFTLLHMLAILAYGLIAFALGVASERNRPK